MKNAGCATFLAHGVAALLILAGLTSLFTEPGVALFMMLGGAAIIWAARRRRTEPSRPGARLQDTAPPSITTFLTATGVHEDYVRAARSPSRTKSKSHKPPSCPPPGTPVEPWGKPQGWMEVKGTFAQTPNVRRLLSKHPGWRGEDGAERRDAQVALVPDPANPHDDNAVAVFMDNHHVGYLPREHAAAFHPQLRQLQQQGRYLTTTGRIWGKLLDKSYSESARVVCRADVDLPPPELLTPDNNLPVGPHAVLPGRHTVQVTKEEDHQDVLARYVSPKPGTPVAVELRPVTEQRARTEARVVQVELDGERVGILSPVQTKNLMPIVEHLEASGLRCMARAVVVGSSLHAEVVLYTVKASDDIDSWLDQTLRDAETRWGLHEPQVRDGLEHDVES